MLQKIKESFIENKTFLNKESFMYHLNKGRIYLDNKPISNKHLKELELFVDIFSSIFPQKWDFIWDVSYIPLTKKFIFNIMGIRVHFPEVTISNECNLTHNIKDLFVDTILGFKENPTKGMYIIVKYIEAFRTTFTQLEASIGYTHSHVPSFSSREEFKFTKYSVCLGSSTLAIARTKINDFGITKEDILNLCLGISAFVRTESIEGGPYIKISKLKEKALKQNNIFTSATNRSFPNYSLNQVKEEVFNRLLSHLKNTGKNIPIMITFNKVLVKDLAFFDKIIIDVLLELKDTTNYAKTFLLLNVNNNTYNFIDKEELLKFIEENNKEKESTFIKEFTTEDYIIFRGEKFYIKHIIQSKELPTKEEILNIKYTLRETFRRVIKNCYEKYTTDILLRKAREKRYKN